MRGGEFRLVCIILQLLVFFGYSMCVCIMSWFLVRLYPYRNCNSKYPLSRRSTFFPPCLAKRTKGLGHLLPSVNHDEYFWFLVVEASLFAPLKLSFSSVRDFRYIVLKHKRYITTRQDPFILHQGPKPIVFHQEHISFKIFNIFLIPNYFC